MLLESQKSPANMIVTRYNAQYFKLSAESKPKIRRFLCYDLNFNFPESDNNYIAEFRDYMFNYEKYINYGTIYYCLNSIIVKQMLNNDFNEVLFDVYNKSLRIQFMESMRKLLDLIIHFVTVYSGIFKPDYRESILGDIGIMNNELYVKSEIIIEPFIITKYKSIMNHMSHIITWIFTSVIIEFDVTLSVVNEFKDKAEILFSHVCKCGLKYSCLSDSLSIARTYKLTTERSELLIIQEELKMGVDEAKDYECIENIFIIFPEISNM